MPWTGKLDSLGQFQVSPTVEQKLRDDAVKVLESACGAQYVATELTAVCTATNSVIFTTNGTATATAAADLTAANTISIVNYMKKKLIPKYDGRNYICIASVQALAGMFSDSAAGGWQDASKYSPEYAKNIFNGEVGTFFGVKFVEETGYLSSVIGSSTAHGAAVFFGGDAVYEAVAVPEEVRVKVSMVIN